MMEPFIKQAALQFGKEIKSIEAIGDGLIHKTYKASYQHQPPVLLQQVNKHVFKSPAHIIANYCLIYNHLQRASIKIPALLKTHNDLSYWIDDEGGFWRGFEFIEHSFSVSAPQHNGQISAVASCFGSFTRSLYGIDKTELRIILPGFHDLFSRYQQFEKALAKASRERFELSNDLINSLKERRFLVELYEQINKDESAYPIRVMHHDCKVSNVLFDKRNGEVICPVDLDTVMPGKFFSDLGDMIRSMAATHDENSIQWESIGINEAAYQAIVDAYLSQMHDLFTPEEKKLLHYSGLLIIYMQALRFITDFLNNDVYYHITYENQNWNRAQNQFLLLTRLEEFLNRRYGLVPSCTNI